MMTSLMNRSGFPRLRHLVLVSSMTLTLTLLAVGTGFAQSSLAASGAQSLLIDPSVRASGMGRTSNAVFWGNDPDDWGNPALLAGLSGIRYAWGKTRLVPDLAEDVYFRTKRLTLGYWGVGVLMAGKPFHGLGGSKLDYGTSIATDVDGNVIGTFNSYEEIRSLGVAVNTLELAEHVLNAAGFKTPVLSRFGDVGIGWTEKRTHVFLAPAYVTLDGIAGEGSTTTHDSGVLFRLTPYNAMDYPGLLPSLDRLAPIRLDVSYARSTQNYDNAYISYIDPDQSDPIARIHRTGWAAHFAAGTPPGMDDWLKSRRLGWLPAWISPLISWGKAGDRELPLLPDRVSGGLLSGTRVQHSGWEVTFANIYSIRRGRIDDPVGTIQGTTSGWGLGLRLKDVAEFSYDRATVPQATLLGPVHRTLASMLVNPVKIWAAAHADARSRTPLSVSLFGGYNTYGMSDVNGSIRQTLTAFPGSTGDAIKNGAGFGAGLRVWPGSRTFLSLEYERLLAAAPGSGTYLGSTYQVDLNVPADGLALSIGYMARPTANLRVGLAAGPGYYSTSGNISVSRPGFQDETELEASGFGVRGMALALLKLTRSMNAELGAGYRYAKTTDVTANGTRFRNADGSLAKIDWSGFTGRAGLTFYIADK